MKVLIAEDEAVTRRLLEASLAKWGYLTVSTDNGDDAWAAIEGGKHDIGIAILDLVMPGLGGLEVCRKIRRRTDADYIYVILLTAHGGTESTIEGLAAGADDYIVKPFESVELQLRIKAGVRIVELERALLQANRVLKIEAQTDGLTRLLNHVAALRRLEEETSRARREGKSLAVLMADIDHFKQVNDTYGHAAGDKVLAELAQRMARACRDYDIIGRYGGEEFIIVLPDSDLNGGTLIAERIRHAVASEPFSSKDEQIQVTVSIGVASESPADGRPLAELLLKAADDALYEAKRLGRNRVAVVGNEQPAGLGGPASAAARTERGTSG